MLGACARNIHIYLSSTWIHRYRKVSRSIAKWEGDSDSGGKSSDVFRKQYKSARVSDLLFSSSSTFHPFHPLHFFFSRPSPHSFPLSSFLLSTCAYIFSTITSVPSTSFSPSVSSNTINMDAFYPHSKLDIYKLYGLLEIKSVCSFSVFNSIKMKSEMMALKFQRTVYLYFHRLTILHHPQTNYENRALDRLLQMSNWLTWTKQYFCSTNRDSFKMFCNVKRMKEISNAIKIECSGSIILVNWGQSGPLAQNPRIGIENLPSNPSWIYKQKYKLVYSNVRKVHRSTHTNSKKNSVNDEKRRAVGFKENREKYDSSGSGAGTIKKEHSAEEIRETLSFYFFNSTKKNGHVYVRLCMIYMYRKIGCR